MSIHTTHTFPNQNCHTLCHLWRLQSHDPDRVLQALCNICYYARLSTLVTLIGTSLGQVFYHLQPKSTCIKSMKISRPKMQSSAFDIKIWETWHNILLFLPGGISLAFLTLFTPAQCLPAVTSSHPLLKVYNSTRIAGRIGTGGMNKMQTIPNIALTLFWLGWDILHHKM